MFHVTEASHANLCGDHRLLQRREAAIARGRTTGAIASATSLGSLHSLDHQRHRKNIKAVANSVFQPSLPPTPYKHQPGHDFAHKLDHCIPAAASSMGLRGCASPPKRSQERQPPSPCRHKQSAGSRGAPQRTPAVARLVVCQRVFLDLCALFQF